MKLIEAVKELTGKGAYIPCYRSEYPGFLKEMGYNVGAEIGVYKGEFTEKFCQAGLKMYAIDPWIEPERQERQDFLYGHTGRLLAPYDCEIIRKTSMDALGYFENGSLDFVYIDGNHEFRYIAEDLCEWSKKVRPGGIISGHDYYNTPPDNPGLRCQVGAVVDAYTEAFNINPWYLFGIVDPDKEPNRKERFFSWMWIKNA